jgi:hypothetical protein
VYSKGGYNINADRLNFTKGINYNNFPDAIKNFFDENMILYDLIGEYSNYSVTGTIDNELLTFSLTFKNVQEAYKMKNIIDLQEVEAYGRSFIINSELQINILKIQIQLKNRVSG